MRFFVFQVFKSPGLSSRANPLKSSLRARSRDLEQLFKKTFWNPSTERKVTACANLLCGRGGTYNSHRIDLRNPIELHEPAHMLGLGFSAIYETRSHLGGKVVTD